MKKSASHLVFPFFIFFGVILCIVVILVTTNSKEYDASAIEANFLGQSEIITIENSLPISDIVGKKLQGDGTKKGIQGYLDFTVKSNVDEKVEYEVYLLKLASENEIRSNYIKLYLTDANTDKPYIGYDTNIIPTYYDLKVAESDLGGKVLYSGTLDAHDSNNFRLRVWLSESYVISKNLEQFSIQVKVNVK